MLFFTRYIVLLFVFLAPLTSCKQTVHGGSKTEGEQVQTKDSLDHDKVYPKFVFTKEIHKFGNVTEGEIVVCEFYFRNVGDANLIIKSIESSCGCTAVKWDKNPIKKGEESRITVEFDSKGRHGKQYKVLTIFANTKPKVKELKITATVK